MNAACCPWAASRALSAAAGSVQPRSPFTVPKAARDGAEGGRGVPSPREHPWAIGTYYSKKQNRKTKDALGNLDSSIENLRVPAAWAGMDGGARMLLALGAVSRELGVSEARLLEGLDKLVALIPEVRNAGVPEGSVFRMAADVEHIAERLVHLKAIMPGANAGLVAARFPAVLKEPLADVQRRVDVARGVLLPRAGRDAARSDDARFWEAVERCPGILDVDVLPGAVQELARLMPHERDVLKLLSGSPQMFVAAQGLAAQSRGDRDPEYLDSTLRGS
ncbi:unnamed protein product [Pedinophyceae sp. YPF-701]|nr:unnamed protein product [Pedinophyceae sp. YPF-701]